MTALAATAVALALGAWLGIRWADASRRVDDLIAAVLSTPLPEPSACAACDPGAADIGARADLPPAGAGPTSEHPASALQPAQRTPGHN